MKVILLLAGLLLGLASCSDEPQRLEDPQAIVDALEGEGIECQNLDVTSEFTESESMVQSRGLCDVAGEDVVVSTFATKEDRDRWLRKPGVIKPVAVGDNWVVSTRSEDLTDEVADALGGTVATD